MLVRLQKLYALLTPQERTRGCILLVMIVLMGIFDMIGVASIMPFIAVIGDPSVIQSNEILRSLYTTFGFSTTGSFLFFLGSIVFLAVLGSLVFKGLTQWAIARYVYMRSYALSSRLLQCYLNRPYGYFLQRHSADMTATIIGEVHAVVNRTLLPVIQTVSGAIVSLLLVGLVITASPNSALFTLLVLGGSYVVIYRLLQGALERVGQERAQANRNRQKVVQEAFSGIKDIKVKGLEDAYLRSFRRPAQMLAKAQTKSAIMSSAPQFLLQGLAFGGIIAMVLVLLHDKGNDVSRALPVIGLYAFAGLRLLPALQTVYQGFAQFASGGPALDLLFDDLVDSAAVGAPLPPGCTNDPPLELRDKLELVNVSFTYPTAERAALRDLSLAIDAGSCVGLVGTTGAGKTTVVDLILGLLEPQQGVLRVDGRVVAGRQGIRCWQRSIGYVPQSAFLADEAIAANIALGVPPQEVDTAEVERAARAAQLHDFIMSELPDGYATIIGEGGVRLSGGQRQRIGIARALYHDPTMLILDEATSALDNATEQAVMAAIHAHGNRRTIIMIAHRHSSLTACDQVFHLEKGRILACGTYGEFIATQDALATAAVSGGQ